MSLAAIDRPAIALRPAGSDPDDMARLLLRLTLGALMLLHGIPKLKGGIVGELT